MKSEDHPRNMTQEEHSHNAAKHKGKISFSPPRFSSTHVGEPRTTEIFIQHIIKNKSAAEREIHSSLVTA